ncbi:hypothetical protein HPP92_011894 [Vanilla planifolia]|uniref:Uncharacterized protein n=1 Tax=Vanilla planifolia TaxID=51239 RepID=A0A835R9C8_VANPL|nr:hypothetical protein HPP92_011894 [Vanilla planifolia]
MSGNVNIQNISLFHSHSSSSSYQENENSLSINISTRGNSSQEFCQVFSTLAAQGSRCSLTNLAFYDVNWEQKPLYSFGSLLDNNSSIKDVEFHRNVFGTKALLDLSHILGRNKRIRGIIFSACQLESIGAGLIASALTKNDSLEELQIWEDSVGSTGAEELSRMIEINSTLKLLLIFDKQSMTATPLLSAVLARNRNMEVHIWINDEAAKILK